MPFPKAFFGLSDIHNNTRIQGAFIQYWVSMWLQVWQGYSMEDMSTTLKRWYDKRKNVSNAVHLLGEFPVDVQLIIAEGIVSFAETEFQASEKFNSIRTLGTDKVLSLYKSKNKRREYDKN